MSDIGLQDELRAIEAAARFDEALAAGEASAQATTRLEPGLEQLIRDLHAQLGPKPVRSDVDPDPGPQWYGRFRLIRRLGAGTYGVVHLADDPVLKREVALKIPRAHVLESDALRRRFVREAQAAARLKHPHIVQVFQADVEGDEAYIATEYCPGPNLDQWLRRRATPVPPRIAAEIVANLAEALGCAHAVGILHRDVKPGNVLLAAEAVNDADVARHVRLSDFGLARILEQEAGTATADGALMGTFAYMAPEQVHQSHGEVGPATDVHALGAVLYELLTLHKPFGGDHHSRILLRINEEIPTSPRELTRGIPRDLEAICLRCLEKSPAARYRDGHELSADLQRFLLGEAVSARRPALREMCGRLVRRHPTATALCSTVALATGILLALLTRHNGVLEQSAGKLRATNFLLTSSNTQLAKALADAKSARDEARDAVYSHDLRHAFSAAASGDARMVANLLNKYADESPLAEYRGVEWEYLSLRSRRSGRELFRSAQPQYMSALSPDQRRLALVGADGTVRIFAWPEGELLAEWPGGQGEVNGICFSPDGNQLWTAGDDGTLCSWDLAAQSLQARFNAHGPELAFEVVQDPGRGCLYSCGREGTIRIWDAATGASLGELAGHTGTVDTLELSPDRQTLYSQSKDETLRFWDLTTLTCRRVIDTSPHRVSYIRLSPDGRWLAASTPSSLLIIFDLQSGAQVLNQSTLNEPTRLCFDDSSRRLFVGDLIGVIHEWELGADGLTWASTTTEWQAHGDEVSHLNWSSSSSELISVGRDGTMQAWQASLSENQLQHEFHHPSIRDFVNVPGHDRLLIACRDGIVAEEFTRRQTQDSVGGRRWLDRGSDWHCVAASNDGLRLAAGDGVGRIVIWNTCADRPAHVVTAFEGRLIHSVAFTPDERRLCVTTTSASEPVWIDTETGSTESALLEFACNQIEFSGDGRLFAAAFERHINVARFDSQEHMCTLPKSALHRHLLAFVLGDDVLVVGAERTARTYDTRTGRIRTEFLGHQGDINGLAVSRDGKTLVTVSGEDGTVRLWHLATGEQLASFKVADRSGFASTQTALCCFSDRDESLVYSLDADHVRVVRLRDFAQVGPRQH
ncbi:MAG: protein kinase [Planctomycetaceae bacterium]